MGWSRTSRRCRRVGVLRRVDVQRPADRGPRATRELRDADLEGAAVELLPCDVRGPADARDARTFRVHGRGDVQRPANSGPPITGELRHPDLVGSAVGLGPRDVRVPPMLAMLGENAAMFASRFNGEATG